MLDLPSNFSSTDGTTDRSGASEPEPPAVAATAFSLDRDAGTGTMLFQDSAFGVAIVAPALNFAPVSDTAPSSLASASAEIAFTIVDHPDIGDISGSFAGHGEYSRREGDFGLDPLFADYDEICLGALTGGRIDFGLGSIGPELHGFTNGILDGAIGDDTLMLNLDGLHEALDADGYFRDLLAPEGRFEHLVLDVSGGNEPLKLDALVDRGTTLLDALLQAAPTVYIRGDDTDTVSLGQGWQAIAETGDYNAYTDGTSTIYIQSILHVIM